MNSYKVWRRHTIDEQGRTRRDTTIVQAGNDWEAREIVEAQGVVVFGVEKIPA